MSTVESVMTKRLVSLHPADGMRRAAAVFLDKGISGAAVVRGGRAVGVLTKTDLIRYERERAGAAADGAMRTLDTLENVARGAGFHEEPGEDVVSRWMTPAVFTVRRDASLAAAAEAMVRRRIHRLFVEDARSGRLVGVVTSFDLLRTLCRRRRRPS